MVNDSINEKIKAIEAQEKEKLIASEVNKNGDENKRWHQILRHQSKKLMIIDVKICKQAFMCQKILNQKIKKKKPGLNKTTKAFVHVQINSHS